jgi:hypothetical protein
MDIEYGWHTNEQFYWFLAMHILLVYFLHMYTYHCILIIETKKLFIVYFIKGELSAKIVNFCYP